MPLCALAVLFHPARPLRKLWGLAPFAVLAVAYCALVYLDRGTHLHFNDGTFSLNASFAGTLLRSLAGLLWVWGVAALAILFTKAARPWRLSAMLSLVWMVLTLLPYSFLTYMPRVPSRHTYLASVGLSVIVAMGLLCFRQYARRWNQAWPVPVLASLIVVHQCGYLWTVKHRQYAERARPTEDLIRTVSPATKVIHAKCFPYSPVVADLALQFRVSEDTRPVFMVSAEAAQHPNAVDFCNAVADGVHY